MRDNVLCGELRISITTDKRFEAVFIGDGKISKMSLGASSSISALEALKELVEMMKLHYKNVDLMTTRGDNQ